MRQTPSRRPSFADAPGAKWGSETALEAVFGKSRPSCDFPGLKWSANRLIRSGSGSKRGKNHTQSPLPSWGTLYLSRDPSCRLEPMPKPTAARRTSTSCIRSAPDAGTEPVCRGAVKTRFPSSPSACGAFFMERHHPHDPHGCLFSFASDTRVPASLTLFATRPAACRNLKCPATHRQLAPAGFSPP
jgi:hypothetical protein